MASDRMGSSGDRARAEVERPAWIMGIRSLLEGQLELLFEHASDLGNLALQMDDADHQGCGSSRKHPLQLRVRRFGYAIALEWSRVAWQGANGQEQRLPRVFRWQGTDEERFDAVQREADECRGQAACLAEMLVTLGRLERAVQAHPLHPRGQGEPPPSGITVLSGPTVQRTGCET